MTPREELASALRKARLAAGFNSHGALAAEMHLNRTVVTKAESGHWSVPTPETLEAWALATGADLAEFTELAARCRSSTPDWFVPYLGAESRASLLRIWSPDIVPGLFQTERYAREILSVYPHSPERLTELVKERMRRQGILERAHLVVALDVAVLGRRFGSAEIMAEQLAHLVEVAQRPNVALHVVPEHSNTGAWAELNVASHGATATVNLTTATDDVTSTAIDQVDKAMQAFERVMGHARTLAESLESLKSWQDTWRQQI